MAEFDSDRHGDFDHGPAPRRRRRARGRGPTGLDAGAVIGRSFSLYFGRLGTYAPITLIAMSPMLIANYLLMAMAKDLERPNASVFETISNLVDFLLLQTTVAFLLTVLGQIGSAFVAWCAFHDARGKSYAMREALRSIRARLLPILGASVVIGFATSIGYSCLCLPGVALATIWFVAMPVLVIDGRGVFASLGRSFGLVSSVFWPVLGVWVVFAVVQFGVAGVIGGIFHVIDPTVGLSVQWLANAVAIGLMTVAQTMAYLEIRDHTEGLDAADLADVFQ